MSAPGPASPTKETDTEPGFAGFPRAGLELLTRLGGADKPWFQAHRGEYDTGLASPAKAFVVAVGERLAHQVSPDVQAVPRTNGSIAPINNDLRFRPDAPPYKDHLLFRWWEGPDRKVAPTLFVRLSEASVGFATGVALHDLDRWRDAVADEVSGPALTTALAELAEGRDLDVVGAELKRVPAPHPPDHPRADLLRHKGFQARWTEPTPAQVTDATFVEWCVERLVACSPVHRWLVDELA